MVGGDDWEVRLKAFAAASGPAAGATPTPPTTLRQTVTGLQARMRDGAALTTWPALTEWGRQTYAALVGDLEERRLPEE